MSPSPHTDIEVTPELLHRYDKPGPRYTSYPTAPEWDKEFGATDYDDALVRASADVDEVLSIYVHLPFCWQRCLFCGCNVIISKKHELSDEYLGYLYREIKMTAARLGDRRKVKQLHWGGGTPTYLNETQLTELFGKLSEHFDFVEGAEIALEVDPRVTTENQLTVLRELGFNRISMGVQDLDPKVQAAITRNQTEAETRQLFDWSREKGFGGINLDLIYGLPEQNAATWERTIRSVIDIRPDRVAVYSYAHLPEAIKHQKKIDHYPRPEGDAKLELFVLARKLFLEAGYKAIGMDHFALPTDELAIALEEKRLHRNFMGYSVVPAADMIGFGVSAIGEVGGAYAQNEKRPVKYFQKLDAGELPTMTGITLSDDDKVRRWLIRQLMCNFEVNFAMLKERFGVDYDTYFAADEALLDTCYAEGFIERTDVGLNVLPLGQAFIRNICMAFDTYLRKPSHFKNFSRTV